MPRSAGSYSLPPVYLATPGEKVRAEQHNVPLEDVAAALTGSLPRDGSAPMIGNLPMGGRRVTGLGAPSADTDAARKIDLPGAATTEAAGTLRLATTAETVAGTATDRAVTPAGVAAALAPLAVVPPGAVMPFAMSTPPTGWLACGGQTVSRTTYAALFAAIGTTFGTGDGGTTFNLPDLRGEFVRGWDNGRGVDSGRAFGSAQLDQMQRITGTFQQYENNVANATAGAFTKGGQTRGGSGDSTFADGRLLFDSALSPNARAGAETRPRNVALFYCIKV